MQIQILIVIAIYSVVNLSGKVYGDCQLNGIPADGPGQPWGNNCTTGCVAAGYGGGEYSTNNAIGTPSSAQCVCTGTGNPVTFLLSAYPMCLEVCGPSCEGCGFNNSHCHINLLSLGSIKCVCS